MKNIIIVFALFCFSWSFTQEKTSDIEEATAFEVIDEVPVYRGCESFKSNINLKKCMSTKIAELISKKFRIKVAKNIGLPDGLVRIAVTFKINKNGDIVDINARAPHKALEKEAIRVISLIPRLKKPGYQRNKPVTVPYALPINFVIENKKKHKN